MKWRHLLLFGCALPLVACTQQSSNVDVPATEVSGAKSGVFTLLQLDTVTAVRTVRPASLLGVYTSMFLSQGGFAPVRSAQLAIAAQEKIVSGQTGIETSETFTILKELGVALQVNIPDMLNRSTDRPTTLDTYLRSLTNLKTLADRKAVELEALEDQSKEERTTKRKEVRELNSAIQKALRSGDYEFAGSKQEELSTQQSELAEIETRVDQAGDVLKAYEKLLKVANERLSAITLNRAVLLAGLKVIEVPGVDELEVLEPDSLFNRRDTDPLQQGVNPMGILGE